MSNPKSRKLIMGMLSNAMGDNGVGGMMQGLGANGNIIIFFYF